MNDRSDRAWILLPDVYQPDTKDSREESGMKYIKYYSEDSYSALLEQAEALAEAAKKATFQWACPACSIDDPPPNVPCDCELIAESRIDGLKELNKALQSWQNFKGEL